MTTPSVSSYPKSTHKGVTFCKQTGLWKAIIWRGGDAVWLGRYSTEQEAGRAYDEYARRFPETDRSKVMHDYYLRQLARTPPEEIRAKKWIAQWRKKETNKRSRERCHREPWLKERSKRNKIRLQIARHKLLWEYLLQHPCACGETDPIVMEFDHDNGKDGKVDTVARMMNDGRRWESILQEIQKCTVRCANCHRRRTATQQRWWRVGMGQYSPF